MSSTKLNFSHQFIGYSLKLFIGEILSFNKKSVLKFTGGKNLKFRKKLISFSL